MYFETKCTMSSYVLVLSFIGGSDVLHVPPYRGTVLSFFVQSGLFHRRSLSIIWPGLCQCILSQSFSFSLQGFTQVPLFLIHSLCQSIFTAYNQTLASVSVGTGIIVSIPSIEVGFTSSNASFASIPPEAPIYRKKHNMRRATPP